MALHRITGITVGVPDPGAVAAFYRDFGLSEGPAGRLSTTDGGEQLVLVERPHRQLLELRLGCDTGDDLVALAVALGRGGAPVDLTADRLTTVEPVTGLAVTVEVSGRLSQAATDAPLVNRPGAVSRRDARADSVLATQAPRPRRLGHVVLGSPDMPASSAFFTDGLGFAVSDTIPGIGSFMRCSTDHHNLLVQAAPVTFLHHTSWEFDDVDAVGARAGQMVEADAGRHVWGLGRHHIGSNFFWYLTDPAGNFAEAYSDMDHIDDAAAWDAKPEAAVSRPLAAWGPPVSIEFIVPPDLPDLVAVASAAS
jgi:catechol 2,3-dioxygenase-like lactoylglutathione lyase family enzyme